MRMADKIETFLITISILEGRHYIWTDMDSAVIVKVDKKRKCTAIKYNSDAPLYNEYFVFEYSTTLDKILEKIITISVIRPRTACRSRKLLGEFTLDVAILWAQQSHQFYHKWAILSKSDYTVGARGYLKVDIALLFKGQVSEVPANALNDEIEGNLLLPDSLLIERQKASYLFDIYKGEYLVARPSNNVNNKTGKAPNVYVEVSFAGQTVRTSVKRNTQSPVFNEQLTIMDLFPPLSHRIKIEICYAECCKKSVNASRYLDLKYISNDKEEGFLPTFGPTYLHMYFNNNLGGFAGKILVSMNTELEEILPTDAKTTGTLVKSIAPINEENQFDDVVLFAIIFGATAITKGCCDRVISCRMTFGSTLVHKGSSSAGDNVLLNSTATFKPKKISKQYHYLPLEKEKPCLVITRQLPSCRRRMYNSNMLSKIANELKTRLQLIEKEFKKRDYKPRHSEVYEIINDVFDFIRTSGRKYMDIVEEYNFEYGTKLDRERKQMCLKEMANILNKVEKLCYPCKTRIKVFDKIQELLDRIESLIFDVQDCWPDIHLWMIFGNKKTAFCRIPARDILFSPIDEEKGEFCGKMRSIYFYPHPQDHMNLSCKMDIKLWLGTERHKNNCFESIPEGYQFDKETVLTTRNIVAEAQYIFYLRAHIFQGKISPGFDKTGLADTYVRVVIQDKQGETRVKKAQLNPIWNETVTISGLIFYGSKLYLKNNIPTVLMEVLDTDIGAKHDFVGRALITPKIKFREDPYAAPNFPPKLSWNKTFQGSESLGEVLCAFEYIEAPEPEDNFQLPSSKMTNIPDDIIPTMVPYRIEVLFWGVRDMKKIYCAQINRPRVTVICEDKSIVSDTIENAKKHSNFPNKYKALDIMLPLEEDYTPPLCVKIHDSRRFGVYFYAGVNISDVHSYFFHPLTIKERNKQLTEYSFIKRSEDLKHDYIKFKEGIELQKTTLMNKPEPEPKLKTEKGVTQCLRSIFSSQGKSECSKNDEPQDKLFNLSNILAWFKDRYKKNDRKSITSLGTYTTIPQEEPETDEYDWWTKFYESQETLRDSFTEGGTPKHTLKIYSHELERVPEFNGFTDMFTSFKMYRGKRTETETIDDVNVNAIFKGSVKIYRWPQDPVGDYVNERGLPLDDGVFQNYPDNLPVRFVLRVYCIQGLGLRPKDKSGKSDPYLYITLGDNVINDCDHYIPRQINPVFGRLFEFNGNFPNDHTLIISVWDFDMNNPDDLIGETEIDIENRFYTKHRAFCGIADHYAESGYCTWRGRQKPAAILMELCRTWGLDPPEYQENCVRIGVKMFVTENFTPSGDSDFDREVLSLTVLRRWSEMPVVGFPLVPEHVETRSLYHPTKTGIEQGKLQLWIDIFPITDLPPPNSVAITPRKPVKYELRVIIWNTEDVVLTEDDFFLGERKSDIYIKGWIIDSRDAQCTDVHYKSLTGEGNFNWRFVFPFDYLSSENKVVFKRKESAFSNEETEYKIPCKLTLQIWDNDTFAVDDFLGTLSLELWNMPRGARDSKKCTLSILEPHAPKINLFKVRRSRGWWPFKNFNQELGKETLQGKVEAELEILTCDEAKISPAGLGRDSPQGLTTPKRPDVSFSWFRNPLKALKYVICKLHRRKIIKAFLVIILIALILVAIYSVPGYTVKRILGA